MRIQDMGTPMYAISACLIGIPCRYNGSACTELSPQCAEALRHLVDLGQAIVVCPEVLGGLPTPRAPSEIIIQKHAQGQPVRRVVDAQGASFRGMDSLQSA